MKTAIVYASKTGYAAECGTRLAQLLGTGSAVFDIKAKQIPQSFNEFDAIVVGASVRAGKLPGSIKKFLEKHGSELEAKRLGLFVCGTETEATGQQKCMEANFPADLLSHAAATGWFGGRIILSEHNFIIRGMLKKIMKSDQDLHGEKPEAIETFARTLMG